MRLIKAISRHALCASLSFALLAGSAPPTATAQGRVSLIRDAEIEKLIRDYATPIFRAAGVGSSATNIYLINKREFNAFVADGRRLFLNVGVIRDAETPNEVIGVLAHETGHIAGGHLMRLRDQMRRMQIMAAVGALVGAGIAASGAANNDGSAGQLGQGIAAGSQTAAQRALLSYKRGEELTADRAALTYLERTGQSAKGMLKVFERFAQSSMFLRSGADPYALSHPMPRQRIAQLETLAKKSRHFDTPDAPALVQRHALARAKLSGYLDAPQTVRRRYPDTDKSLAASYARTISEIEYGSPRRAIKMVDALIKASPGNPYFHELKGDALIKMGRPKDAIAPMAQAVQIDPKDGLLRISLGQALVTSDNARAAGTAVEHLNIGLRKEPEHALGWQLLARAHALGGNVGMAEVATAQGHFAGGSLVSAKTHAARAQALLPNGSPGWLQADDIMSYKP